jgi:speckle-type POZ protein
MIAKKMLESNMNTVEIADFEEDVVEDMLKYIYTGRVESSMLPDKASNLLQIAEKYDLHVLKKECEYTLASSLTMETCADVLVLAHLHSADVLKGKVVDFNNR